MRWGVCVVVACVAGCGSGSGPPPTSNLGVDEMPLVVSQRCPGDPGCPAGAQSVLSVGYGVREITPPIEPFNDLNGDQRWEPGEPYTDLNHNGQFDDFWLFNTGNAVLGTHDPIWARCYALEQDATRLVHCSLDAGGYMHNEVEQIRANLDPALGVDYLMVSATHDHSAPDTVGIFGPDDTTSGYRPEWMRQVRAHIVAAITDAVRSLQPATMTISSIATEEPGGDMSRIIDDTRDPVVIDNVMHLMHFTHAKYGYPIVTVINWTAHPDSMSHGNHYISSEFPYWLRQDVELHSGAPVVYVSGSVGGQIGSGRLRVVTDDGLELPCGERSFRFIEAWAHNIARYANKAFDARVPVDSPKLSFRTSRVSLHVDNVRYHTAFALHLFPRQLYGFDPKLPTIRDGEHGDNAPLIDSELAYVRLGPAAIATMPGELLPELFIGGYDGSHKGNWEPFIHSGPIVDWCDPKRQTNDGNYPEPPDVTRAPRAPYLFDEMGGEPAHRMIFGLTQDMLGYIVPPYNFYLDPIAPYLVEPPGDSHYEETNSLGPRAAPEMVGTMRQLAQSAEQK